MVVDFFNMAAFFFRAVVSDWIFVVESGPGSRNTEVWINIST